MCKRSQTSDRWQKKCTKKAGSSNKQLFSIIKGALRDPQIKSKEWEEDEVRKRLVPASKTNDTHVRAT